MPRSNLCKPKDQIAIEKLCKWVSRQEKQKVIAAGIGVSEQTMSYKLKHKSLTAEDLLKIFHFLETEPEEIGKLLTF